MDLEPRLLRYFIAVAEERHFGARRRGCIFPSRRSAMPSASWSRAWGAPAGAHQPPGGADRGGQGAVPRGPGAAAAGRGRARAGAARRCRLRGRLRIGFVGSMLYRGLPALLAAMRAELPEVEHVLAELNSHDQIEAVHRGELDLASSTPTRYPKACRRRTWWRNPSSSACRPAQAGAARQPGAGRAGRRGLLVFRARGLAQLLRDGAVAVRDGRLHAAGAARGASLAERGARWCRGWGWRSCRPACRAAGWPARASSASSTRRARSVRRSGRPGAARRCRKARCGW